MYDKIHYKFKKKKNVQKKKKIFWGVENNTEISIPLGFWKAEENTGGLWRF